MSGKRVGLFVVVSCGLAAPLAAQPLTIGEAVGRAGERYPAIAVSAAQLEAAAAQIRVARLAYLPRAELLAQANRATRNNIFGMLLPQSTIPSISGPPRMENSMTSVWGSAAGTLVSWEPFDFGARSAQVAVAEAGKKRAEASLARTRFDAAALAADSYLTLLAARETEQSALAARERAQTLVTVVEALVKAELRPGADLSRMRAEVSAAETQRIEARRAIAAALATLGELLGSPVSEADASALPEPTDLGTAAGGTHPATLEQMQAVEEAQARTRAVSRSVYPHIALQGAVYARGTGAMPDGTTLGGVNGLGPNIANWGAGITLTVPLAEYAGIRTRRDAEIAREQVERARLDQIRRDLQADEERAMAALTAARQVAAEMPQLLTAARDSERQATARYRAGLGTLIEVADAQRVLAQAEIDHALARLAIWRAEFAVARARGDLAPVLREAAR